MVTLVAIAPAGDVLIVRSGDGLWLVQPEILGGTVALPEQSSDVVIARQGLLRIDRDFESWGQVEEFRQGQAAGRGRGPVVDETSLDRDDVQRMLTVAQRWVAEGETQKAVSLAARLLELPAVRRNDDVAPMVTAFLIGLTTPQVPAMEVSTSSDQQKQRARQRWSEVRDIGAVAA